MRLRDTDPFVAMIWSFGNNMRDYMYSREIEPYKKACHYAVVYEDFSLLRELCPEVCESCVMALDGVTDKRERRVKFGTAVTRWLDLHRWPGVVSNNPLYASCRNTTSGKRHSLELQSLERLQSSLTMSAKDYAEVEIPEDSVIYCDIPYKETKGYVGAMKFDYVRFYDWCEMQTQPVFISSYKMQGGRFDCVAEFAHQSSIGTTTKTIERIFVPANQKERGYTRQLNLFL